MTLGQLRLFRHPSLRPRWISNQRQITNTFSTSASTQSDEVDPKAMAKRYQKQRILYNQQVSSLRKQYAREISAKKKAEEAAQAKEREEIEQRKKERQRLKNLRSIENAKRDIAEKAERAKEFALELEETQKKREARDELFVKARRLLLEDLEKESAHWMTTPEEVEEKLGGWQTEQLLWSTPHLIGVAPEDSIFWRFQSHTLPRQNTLMSPREYILEKLEERLIISSNINHEFWTPERRRDVIKWQEKAKLRALVQNNGRAMLLKRQNQMLQEEYLSNAPEMPKTGGRFGRKTIQPRKKIPSPSMEILANYEVQEKEGAKLLMEDPSRFFVFEENTNTDSKAPASDNIPDHSAESDEKKEESTVRGKPISLIHEFGPKGNKEPYPIILAKQLQEDKRTEKEKKRAQKEDERLAKQRASMEAEQGGVDFEHDSGPPAEIKLGKDDEVWEEEMLRKYGTSTESGPGLTLEDLKNIPLEERLFEEDVEWIVDKLQSRLKNLEEKKSTEAQKALEFEEDELMLMNKADVVMQKLNDSQLMALSNLDLSSLFEDEELDEQQIVKEIQACIGSDTLSKDDLKTVIEIERKLSQDENLKGKLLN